MSSRAGRLNRPRTTVVENAQIGRPDPSNVLLMLTTIIALLACQGPVIDDSLLAKIVPVPTGKNGYEDYLRACDLAGPDTWPMYEQLMAYRSSRLRSPSDPDLEFSPLRVPPGTTLDSSELRIRIAANDRVGGAFDVISIGNNKQVYDPRTSLNYQTSFPELGRFKMLAKIGINKAYVEFAEGKSGVATKDLLEGLKFSKNVFGSALIPGLVSIAMQAIFLAEFNRHLGQLSYSDAQLIDKTCEGLIAKPYPVREALQHEFQMTANSIDQILEKPESFLSEDENRTFGSAITGLGQSDKDQLKGFVLRALQQRYDALSSKWDGPESGWMVGGAKVEPPISTEDKSVSNLAILVAGELRSGLPQYANAMAKARIQLRLLQLHAKVAEYRWQNGVLPAKIEDFADAKTRIDPFTDAAFHYELKDMNYRLYSTGVPGLGPIELKYRMPPQIPASSADNP